MYKGRPRFICVLFDDRQQGQEMVFHNKLQGERMKIEEWHIHWVLGILWMIAGLIQLISGSDIVGMLDIVAGVQFMIIAKLEEKL